MKDWQSIDNYLSDENNFDYIIIPSDLNSGDALFIPRWKGAVSESKLPVEYKEYADVFSEMETSVVWKGVHRQRVRQPTREDTYNEETTHSREE